MKYSKKKERYNKMLRAYEGNNPYIFISYAHKDSDQVLPIISKLQEKGYRVWYDAGIEAGTEWPEYIAEHLYGSKVFLAFLSQHSLDSQNCRQEINFAIELKKDSFLIYLNDVKLPLGMQMRLSSTPKIHRNLHGSDISLLDEILQSNLLWPCREEDHAPSKGNSADAEQAFLKGLSYDMDKSYAEAVKWYRQAADQGHAQAQYALGCSYRSGEGVPQDTYEAVQWWRKSAEQGYSKAQYNLGNCYSSGVGVVKDPAEAIRWYRLAAEQGNHNAQNNLGNCYNSGEGVTRNINEAIRWYRKAAEQGNVEAQFALGNCYNIGEGVNKDMGEAVKWWSKAAEQGLMMAQYNMGICCENGIGMPYADKEEAAKWYRLAAEQGFDRAQLNLGVCYELGEGVAQDYAEAEKWYRQAAAQGNEKAYAGIERVCQSSQTFHKPRISATEALNIGRDYFNSKSYEEAVQWFTIASDQGVKEAQFLLGYCYSEGLGTAKNINEAVRLYRSSAEQGYASAQCFLANCYAQGLGVSQDFPEAIRWYRKAAQQGESMAQNILRNASISW